MELDSPCIPAPMRARRNGYGVLSVRGKRTYAHRAAWMEAHGPIPKGIMVCHHCDNRECVNVAHLFLGTQKDNMQDMARKKRYTLRDVRGTNHPRAQLTDDVVVALRRGHAQGSSFRELAKKHGLTYANVYDVVKGRSWSHVAGPVAKRAQAEPLYWDDARWVLKLVELGRTSVRQIAHALGIKHGPAACLATRYRKGQIPWRNRLVCQAQGAPDLRIV